MDDEESRSGSGHGSTPPLSVLLRSLPTEQPLRLGQLLAVFDARAHGGALLILGLPDTLPLPIPSMSAVLGIPLVIVAAHLAFFGDRGGVPQKAANLRVPDWLLARLVDDVPPLLARAERLSQDRWIGLARQERLLGLVCLYLSLLLLAPLPFFNMPPAICLVLIAWGMIQRDGVFVAAGLAGTAVMTAALAAILILARSMLM